MVGRIQSGRQAAKGNLISVHPEPTVVPLDDEAAKAVEDLRLQTEAEYDTAQDQQDEVARTVWSRTCEQAKKLALIYACSENHEQPVIRLTPFEWATEFAMHQTRRQLFLAAIHVADNPFHADCLKLMKKLRESPDQCLPRRELMRAMRCKAADFDQVVGTLIQQGDIEVIEIPSATKPAIGVSESMCHESVTELSHRVTDRPKDRGFRMFREV